MDPLAMAGSAMGALNSYKEMLDAAKLALEEGKQLQRAINIFEVTVNMIPPRGDQKKVAEMKKKTGENKEEVLVAEDVASIDTPTPKKFNPKDFVKDYANEAKDYAVETAKSGVLTALGDAVEGTPLGEDLLLYGLDNFDRYFPPGLVKGFVDFASSCDETFEPGPNLKKFMNLEN